MMSFARTALALLLIAAVATAQSGEDSGSGSDSGSGAKVAEAVEGGAAAAVEGGAAAAGEAGEAGEAALVPLGSGSASSGSSGSGSSGSGSDSGSGSAVEVVDEATGCNNANGDNCGSLDTKRAHGMVIGFVVAWVIIVAFIMGYIYNGDALRKSKEAKYEASI